jgi:hypothetical protein
VWATAATTLTAGMPHFTCRCPDGHVKPFCWALWLGSSKCCCDRSSCCSTTELRAGTTAGPEEGSETCCCCSHKDRDTDTSREGVSRSSGDQPKGPEQPRPETAVSQACCQKTLADAEVYSLNPEEVKIAPSCHAAIIQVKLPSLTAASPCVCLWQVCRMPPPTDLVVTLQHLVI